MLSLYPLFLKSTYCLGISKGLRPGSAALASASPCIGMQVCVSAYRTQPDNWRFLLRTKVWCMKHRSKLQLNPCENIRTFRSLDAVHDSHHNGTQCNHPSHVVFIGTEDRAQTLLSASINKSSDYIEDLIHILGKSTVTWLLLRFYKQDSGELMLGSRSIKDYNLTHGLRRHIALVYFQPCLFQHVCLLNAKVSQ